MAHIFHPYFDTDFQLIRDFISQNPTVWWLLPA